MAASNSSNNSPTELGDLSSLEYETSSSPCPSEKSSSKRPSSEKTSSTMPKLKEVRVFLAGKSGAGKSTLMANLFNIPNEHVISAKPITTECITKEYSSKEHGITVLLTDSVGLVGSGVAEWKQEMNRLMKYFQSKKKMPHLLFFCIPVNSTSKFDDRNPVIMRTLQDNFGKEMWKQCIVIFTFSNEVWNRFKKKNNNLSEAFLKYKAHLNEYASLFEAELRKLGVHDVIVRTTFAEDQTTNEGQSKIVALPAGDDEDDEVFAGISSSHEVEDKIENWKVAAFDKIAHSCNKELEQSLMFYKYGIIAGATACGGILGGVAGVMVGGAVGGSISGPGGMIIGAKAITGGGVTAGAAVGQTIGQVITKYT